MQGSSLNLACVAGGISVGVLRTVATSQFEIFPRGKPLAKIPRFAPRFAWQLRHQESTPGQESRQLHRLPNIYLNTLPTCITHLMTGTWETLVYDSLCPRNHSHHSKQVHTGISHSLQQQLFLDNVLKKRNTNDKNVRIFSSISYADPCTAVNSAFKLTTHLQSDSPEKNPSLRFHFNNHWSCRRVA